MTLNTALFAVSFALFCLLHDFIGDEAKADNGGVGLPGWLFPFFPVLLHFFRDYSFVSAQQFVVPTAILACCMALLFLIANARGIPWRTAFALFLFLVPFSVFLIGNLNVLWDDGAHAQVQTARVWYRTRISTADGGERYLIWVDSAIEGEIKISKEIYDSLHFEDELLIFERTGFLGINYTTVEIPD